METIKSFKFEPRQGNYAWRTSTYITNVLKNYGIEFECKGIGSYLGDRNLAYLTDAVYQKMIRSMKRWTQ